MSGTVVYFISVFFSLIVMYSPFLRQYEEKGLNHKNVFYGLVALASCCVPFLNVYLSLRFMYTSYKRHKAFKKKQNEETKIVQEEA